MKRIFFTVFSLFFLNIFFPQVSYAVQLNISPNPGYVNYNVNFSITECNDVTEALMTVKGTSVDGQSIAIDQTTGKGTYATKFPSTGTFTVKLQCGQAQVTKQLGISSDPSATPTSAPNGLTITVDPETARKNESIKFKVSGCNRDTYSKVEWYWWKNVLGEVPVLKTTTTVSNSGTSQANENNGLSNPGEWKVKAVCKTDDGSKKIAHETAFNILDEEAPDKSQMPTNIPPVSPVCREYNEAGKCTSVNTAIGPLCTEAECFISSIFAVILSLSGGIALLIIIYAGYLYMTSRGNAEQVKKAQELITSSLVGLLFIIFSFVIFTTIAKDILQIPGIE